MARVQPRTALVLLVCGGCSLGPVLPRVAPDGGLFTPVEELGGSPDSGSPDSGSPDSGSPGSGSSDGGSPDSGSPDGGSPDSGSAPAPSSDEPPHCDGLPTAHHSACCAALDTWCFRRNPYSLDAHEVCLFGPDGAGSTGCVPGDLPGGWSG